jgi:hypothetical protein
MSPSIAEPTMQRALMFCLAVLLAVPWPAGTAKAEPAGWIFPDDDRHPWDLSFMFQASADARPGYVAGGVLFGIPVAPRGFSDAINDGFYIDIYSTFGGLPPIDNRPGFLTMRVLGGVRYTMQLFDWLCIYPAVRAGPRFVFPEQDDPYVAATVDALFGVLFRFGKVGVRVETGWPGAAVGLAILF